MGIMILFLKEVVLWQMLFDNNTTLGLYIEKQLDGIIKIKDATSLVVSQVLKKHNAGQIR